MIDAAGEPIVRRIGGAFMLSEASARGKLCGELPALRLECTHQPEAQQRLLAHIEMRARRGQPVAALLTELLGTAIGVGDRSLATGLPGSAEGFPVGETYVCPSQLCDRREHPLPAGALPQCHLGQTPLLSS